MKPHEQARLYLLKAAEDEALLDEVLGSPRVSDAVIGFHCQQAAEKLLKASLSFLGVRFRKTHDLRELMDLLEDKGHRLPDHLQDLDRLSPYAVEFRYGLFAWEEERPLNRQAARQLVEALRRWVEQGLV
ncbi:MAG: HEPN domain-containing protein [Deltaproteobacteria bacterium]|nr:HEPN domain-containing protein [Deltaproteobacteria bacterium]